jgi:hypothetical protein
MFYKVSNRTPLQIGTVMFKKPFNVNVETQPVEVNHNVNVTAVSYYRSYKLIEHAGKTAIAVVVAAAVVKTSSEILIHIAKTNIK